MRDIVDLNNIDPERTIIEQRGVKYYMHAEEEAQKLADSSAHASELFPKAILLKSNAIDALRDEKKSLPILSEGYNIDSGDLQVGEMAATLFLGRGVSVEIVSLTFSAGRAYATTQKKHHLVDGQTTLTSGADQTEFNVTEVVTVTGNKTFNFAVSGTPDSPATGTLSFSVGSFQHIPTTNETGVIIDEIVYAQIAADLKGYVDACQIRARELKNQVLTAADIAAVDAINITTGWPATS